MRCFRHIGAWVLTLALLLTMLPVGLGLTAAAADSTVTKTAAELVEDGSIRFRGRSRTINGSVTFDWSASGYEFIYTGGGTITAKMTGTGAALVLISVNGEERTVEVAQTKTVTLAKDLPEGTYVVKVLKEQEAQSGLCQLDTLTYPADGVLQATEDSDLKFEFMGDSITCGSETIGYQRHGVGSYATITAQAFGADWNTISISGYSLIQRTDRPASVPEIWEKESFFRDGGDKAGNTLADCADWDFDRYTPDVVVVNLGTNDNLGANMTRFLNDVRSFTAKLREAYPDAQIVWAYGLMTKDRNHITQFKAAVDELTAQDAKVTFCEFPMSMSGVTDHPDAAEHRAAAKILSAHVAEILGRDDPLAGVDLEAQMHATDTNADLSAVEQAVARTEELNKADYLPSTWQALEEALAPAQEMLSLGGVPYKNYVKNESFEFSFDNWTVTDNGDGTNAPIVNFSSAYDWQHGVKTGRGLTDYTLTQEITGLPEGRYRLSFAIQFGVYADSCYLSITTDGVETKEYVAEQTWDSGYKEYAVEADVTSGSCTVKVAILCDVENGNNPMFDFVRLMNVPQKSADVAAEKLNAAVDGLKELTVDVTALNAAIELAESQDEELHTGASWTALQTALQEAKAVLLSIDESTQQTTLDTAAAALQEAIDALQKRADKTALQGKIDEAKTYKRSEYTTDTWNALQEVLGEAVLVAQDADATAEQVAEAETALQDAIDALVPGQPEIIADTGFEGDAHTAEGTYTVDDVTIDLGWGGTIQNVGADAYAGTNVLQLGGWGRASVQVDLSAGKTYRVEGYLRNRNATTGEMRVWLMDKNNDTDSGSNLGGKTFSPAAGMADYEKFSLEITVPESYVGGYLMLKWQDASSDGVYIDDLSVVPVGGTEPDPDPNPDPDPDPVVPGDVNEDGAIDSKDARLVLQATVGVVTLTETQQQAANVNGDNAIDSKDARWILQAAVS